MKPWLRWLAIGFTLYGALWGLTGLVGVESVRKLALVEMGVDASSSEAADAALPHAGEQKTYPLTVTAIAPLLVQTDALYHCGPLCGVDRRELYLWLPGFVYELGVIREFVH
nr:hypothetical protein [uncultured Rhodoferax sp.]